MLCKLIKPRVDPVVVDEFRGDTIEILRSGPRIPFFGHPKLQGLPRELAGREYGSHLCPRHGFTTAVHEFGKQLVEAEIPPKCQCQIHAVKFAHPPDGETGQVGQFPLRVRGRGVSVFFLLKLTLPRCRLATLQQNFYILRTSSMAQLLKLA